MSTPEITLHGTELSGHTHRVELLLRMLGLPYRFVVAAAAVRGTPEFHKLNPLRQIPVLQDGDLTLADSNAILVYLAKRYAPGSHPACHRFFCRPSASPRSLYNLQGFPVTLTQQKGVG